MGNAEYYNHVKDKGSIEFVAKPNFVQIVFESISTTCSILCRDTYTIYTDPNASYSSTYLTATLHISNIACHEYT